MGQKIWVVVCAANLLLMISCEREPPLETIPLSKLSFDEVETEMIRGGLMTDSVEAYSKTLQGKRVRWSGEIKQLDRRVAYVAVQGSFANVELYLSPGESTDLQPGQTVIFTGVVEAVSLAHIFPPMPKAYVVLKRVQLSKQ